MKTNTRTGKAGYIINGWPNHDRPQPRISHPQPQPVEQPKTGARELFLAFVIGPAIFVGLLAAAIAVHRFIPLHP